MSHSSSRKPRPRTAAFETNPSLWERLERLFQDQRVLPRLLLVFTVLILLVVVVQGWDPPFPFRLNDRVEHGITARVSFKRINQTETNRLRSERASQVPFVFNHDPALLKTLPAKLRNHLLGIAEAESIAMLAAEPQAAFRLTPREGNPSEAMLNAEKEFQQLKKVVGSASQGDAVGNQIDQIVLQFVTFITPLEPFGLLDPAELQRVKIGPNQTLAILAPNPSGSSTGSSSDFRPIVSSREVLLSELVKDSGRLGKSWSQYPDLEPIRTSLIHWLETQAPFTLQYDDAQTQKERERALAKVNPVYHQFNKDSLLVEPGEVITEENLAVLRAEYETLKEMLPWNRRALRTATVFVMLLVLAVLNGYFLKHYEPLLFGSTRQLVVYLGAIVLTVLTAMIASADPWRAEVVPLLVTVMIFAISYNQVLATLTALTLVLIITFATVADLNQILILMSVCATAIIPLSNVDFRSKLIKVGFGAGLVYFLVTWGAAIMGSQTISEVWSDTVLLKQSIWGSVKCLIAGYLVAGSLPFIESIFGVVTDISLLELSDVSHPLLQELVQRAPGTYNHSIAVATIGEAAADRIGANGLLVRVGAYFHDVGKMLKPNYFIENLGQGVENKHEHLLPGMSALVIIGHVKDGADLQRQHHLPQRIIDFAEQHHGTTLVEFFYREATKLAESKQAEMRNIHKDAYKDDVEESNFRYPGPKPQTKETCVMMLADACESASRSLTEPTPKRIENLVKSLSMKRLVDGQFDESPITFKELEIVENSLIKSLIAIYHGRIKYPDQEEDLNFQAANRK